MATSGFFELTTPRHLLAKVQHDLDRLRKNPVDIYAAFDFFVSARHIPDWLHPNDPTLSKALFDAHVELRVCRHIADSGKHFRVTHGMHKQVLHTTRTTDAWGDSWGRAWGNSWGKSALVVELDPADPDTSILGQKIDVLKIAEKTLTVLQGIVP